MEFKNTLQGFIGISLAELKDRAELMQRANNKYVLDTDTLIVFLEAMQNDFCILKINGIRNFTYHNIYWDSPNLRTFYDHNKDRRKRFKVRFRYYLESNLFFFEVKIREARSMTYKYRLPIDIETYQTKKLPESLFGFLSERIHQHYAYTLANDFIPSIQINYQRLTLVSKQSVERITVDHQLLFTFEQQEDNLPYNRYIIEVKSTTGRSSVDRWLQHNHHRPVSKCSKYSIGVNLLKLAHKNTQFTPTIRRSFHKPMDSFKYTPLSSKPPS
ncbi:VTC domain-containing protein [Candidatus Nitrosacidococcus tergens]|uniref:Putative VTC domain-containing protein n=1 Tax=Candidatus Nitrosacidococcus tergens TaxID=553981 RepID=A0A7G1Q8M6_9GAMM|nr:VTC domain-containing protein [Candidatus Nitrosacidococcus tergens]CAB1275350.1 putative VTC domain-containing protein [Candidatus Nitrosacidococcus tergens]